MLATYPIFRVQANIKSPHVKRLQAGIDDKVGYPLKLKLFRSIIDNLLDETKYQRGTSTSIYEDFQTYDGITTYLYIRARNVDDAVGLVSATRYAIESVFAWARYELTQDPQGIKRKEYVDALAQHMKKSGEMNENEVWIERRQLRNMNLEFLRMEHSLVFPTEQPALALPLTT